MTEGKNFHSTSKKGTLLTKDFLLIGTATLATYMSYMILMPTLPLFLNSLQLAEAEIGLIIGISSIAALLIRPFTGKYLNSIGRKTIFVIGLIILFISCLAYNWLQITIALIAVRLVHGVGYGIATTASATIASDVIPQDRIEKGMIYFSYAPTIAFAAAPALGLFIIDHFKFSFLFIVASAFTVLALFFALKIKYSRINCSAKTKRESLFELKALPSVSVLFLVLFAFSSVVVLLPLYAMQIGFSNIGSFFIVYAISICLIRPLAAYLVEFKGYDYVIIPSLLSYCFAAYILSIASSMIMINIAAILFGIAVGNIAATMKAHVMKNLPYDRRGVVTGMYYNAIDLGHGIGPLFWGLTLSYTGFQGMYRLSIVPILIAIIVYTSKTEILYKKVSS